MIASKQEDLFGVLQLERHQQANHFQRLTAFIHIVAQEQVVVSIHVSAVLWGFPDVKETHQVNVVAVQISEDLQGGLQGFNYNWLGLQDVEAFWNQLQDLFPFKTKASKRLDYFLAFFRLHELLNKNTVQIFVWIFLNKRRLNVRTKFPRLFLQLVDWYFANKQAEIFCLHFHLATISRVNRHCNVSLICKFEFLLITHVINVLIFLNCIFVYCVRTLCFSLLRVDFGT